jgi:hypothetical protein
MSGTFSAHLERLLADMNTPQPARSLPREPRQRIYKGRGPVAADHRTVTLVDGEGFTFLGQPHRLDLTNSGAVAFDRDGYGHWLRLPPGAGVGEITALYACEGLASLARECGGESRMRGIEVRLGLAGVRYEARDLGDRVARCYPSRRLVVLHWAAFSLDPNLINYVITGQLGHLAAGSTKRDRKWWQRMDGFYPPSAGDTEDRLAAAWSRAWIGESEDGTS